MGLLLSGCTTAQKTVTPAESHAQGDAGAAASDAALPSADDSGDALGPLQDATEQADAPPDDGAIDDASESATDDGPSLDAHDASASDAAAEATSSCGHDCQGGACVMGVCQPVVLASMSCGGPGQNITLDSNNVYWSWGACGGARPKDFALSDCIAAGTCVFSTPKAGGTTTPLAVGLAPLAINATSVFYDTSSAVMAVPLTGGTATTIASPGCLSVAADSANVYWTTPTSLFPAVLSAPVTGGTPTTLATGQAPRAIAIDANHVYFTDATAGTINAVPIGAGPVTVLASGQTFAVAMVIDSTGIYWTTASTSAGSVMSMPLGGGAPTTLAAGAGYGGPIAVDSANVYFSGSAGLMSVPLHGGTPTTLAGSQGANALAVDSTSIYWTAAQAGGMSLLKLAKPQ
ncbi:MAG TPA: hypothetical protein VF765_19070 [Polyangiaceae bacterium]